MIWRNVIHDITRADNGAKPGEEDEGDLIMEERSNPGEFGNPKAENTSTNDVAA